MVRRKGFNLLAFIVDWLDEVFGAMARTVID